MSAETLFTHTAETPSPEVTLKSDLLTFPAYKGSEIIGRYNRYGDSPLPEHSVYKLTIFPTFA